MKSCLKFFVGVYILFLLVACEDPVVIEQASIKITNLSDYPAKVWLYDYGSSSTINAEIPANSNKTITINDGDAGIDVHGGRAIIVYQHIMNSKEVDEIQSTFAYLDINQMAEVNIDNPFGCINIVSYCQSAFVNISFDGGENYECIEPLGERTKFYDPEDNSITKSIFYFGLTLFGDEKEVEIFEDDCIRLNIFPDAGCIAVNNISVLYNIIAVYLRPSGQSDWGNNQLEWEIEPDDYYALTCTDSINCDIRIYNNENNAFDLMDFYLDNDDILEFFFDGDGIVCQPFNGNRKKTTNLKNISTIKD